MAQTLNCCTQLRTLLITSPGRRTPKTLGRYCYVTVVHRFGFTCRFNLLFLKRFYRIARLMFPCLLSKTLLFFLFLIFIQIAGKCIIRSQSLHYYVVHYLVEELNISNTGQITADFYLALDTKDKAMFKHTLMLSFIITLFTAVVQECHVTQCICVSFCI